MKTMITKFANILFLAALGLIVMQGCKSKEKAVAVEEQGETLIEVYCSGPEYFSDAEYFRANSIGESLDQATAKKKALSNAKGELAGFIETTLKATYDNYVKEVELNNTPELEERYEGLSREVVNQKLNGIRTICEKQTRTSDGKYKTYIAIELAGDEIASMMNERLSNDAKLKIDYDYEKFKETFNKEMQDLEKKRGY